MSPRAVPALLWLLVAPAVADDARLTEIVVVGGLAQPTDVAIAPDGRIFVAEKRGIVRELAAPKAVPTVLVDLRTDVHNYADRGLLSIALDPFDPERWWLYAALTYDAPIGQSAPVWGAPGADNDSCPNPPGGNVAGCLVRGRLIRIGTKAPIRGQVEVLEDQRWCGQFPSHSMAGIDFGPDGALYVAAGDGAMAPMADWGQHGWDYWKGPACDDPLDEGGALRSQDARTKGDPLSWDGAVVRLEIERDDDLAHAVPAPASPSLIPGPWSLVPVLGTPGELVAFGLRNPFRMAFDPLDGSLWIADVGWRTTEELNRVPDVTDEVVENFGWPCREGLEARPEYADLPLCQSFPKGDAGVAAEPAWAWDRRVPDPDSCGVVNGSRALAGFAFATSTAYDPDLRSLWVADLISGCVWSMPRGLDGLPDPDARTVLFRLGTVSLRTAPDGSIWRVDLGAGTVSRVVRVIFADGFESGDSGAWAG
jgi:glucose/arabinose dehydrogenase